jgi:hypothetical protein
LPIINLVLRKPLDPNIIPENIKSGVVIFAGTPCEITGTLEVVTTPTLVRRNMAVGDDLSGKTLYFDALYLPDEYTSPAESYNFVIFSSGMYLNFDVPDGTCGAYWFYNGSKWTKIYGTDGVQCLAELALPANVGTVTSINLSGGNGIDDAFNGTKADLPEL